VIKHLSFDHMLQHARMTLAFAYELGFADFAALEAGEEGQTGPDHSDSL
jgi:leucyl aminopeptidase